MFKYKAFNMSGFVVFLAISSTSVQAQNGFKSSDFLKYASSERENYITIAAGMAGVIATQNNAQQAKCVNGWIAQNRSTGYADVIQTMQKYPSYHPHGVIIAVLQKACGSFKYGK